MLIYFSQPQPQGLNPDCLKLFSYETVFFIFLHHEFIQPIFREHLLCAGCQAKPGGCSGGPTDSPCAQAARVPCSVLLHSTFLIYFLFFLFLAALGLHCCTRALSSCDERGPLFIVVHRPLIAVASLVAEHGL